MLFVAVQDGQIAHVHPGRPEDPRHGNTVLGPTISQLDPFELV